MQTTFYRRFVQFASCCALAVAVVGCSSDGGPAVDSASGAPGQAAGANAGGALAASGGSPQAGAGPNSDGGASGGSPASAGNPDQAGGSSNSSSAGGSAGSTTGRAGGPGSGGTSAASGAAGATGVAGSSSAAGAANRPNVSVYIAGDSTVSQYVLDPNDPKSWAGWGQMLGPNYDSRVTVLDKAVGGRTARRFIQEGTLDAILNVIKPGDYLLVQFGTNDSNTSATYTIGNASYPYLAAAETDFKTYIQQYIDGAVAKKAIPVLVTPPPRNSAYCNGARSLANYGQAMLELGKADGVAVVDLGLKTHAYLSAICPKPATGAQEMFFKVTGSTIDGTHFQENGARVMAGFVADGIGEAKLGLDAYRKR